MLYCGSGPGEHVHRPDVFGTGVHSVPSVGSLLSTQLKPAPQRPTQAPVVAVSSKGLREGFVITKSVSTCTRSTQIQKPRLAHTIHLAGDCWSPVSGKSNPPYIDEQSPPDDSWSSDRACTFGSEPASQPSKCLSILGLSRATHGQCSSLNKFV